MAFDADAQADTVAKFDLLKPYLIEIKPGAISAIILGIKKLNLDFHLKLQNSALRFGKVSKPIPAPQITPTSSLSTFSKGRAASSKASATETKAYWAKRSYFRAFYGLNDLVDQSF